MDSVNIDPGSDTAPTTPAEAVQAGARWLDANVKDWPTKINLRKLAMHSTEFCMLGQINGSASGAYWGAVDRWKLLDDGQALGFDIDEQRRWGWSELDAEWRRVIKLRRQQAREAR